MKMPKLILGILLLVAVSSFVAAYPNVINFTSSTTWVAPFNTTIIVEAWGGGGAGGASTASGSGGSGGAGGQYAYLNMTVVAGTNYSLTIAGTTAGGAGAGAQGGNTTFNLTSSGAIQVRAVGGAGGATNKGAPGIGSTLDGIGTTRYPGGNGTTGFTSGGGGGSGAGSTGPGNNGTGVTGGAAKADNGGAGGTGSINAAGGAGNVYGAGGGGGEATGGTRNGGAGAAGIIRISFDNAADTCTYPGSGNWDILCSDNCVLSTPTNLGNNNITISGTGTTTVSAVINGWKQFTWFNTCRLDLATGGRLG